MNSYRGEWAHSFTLVLMSVLGGSEFTASYPDLAPTSPPPTADTHLIRGWVSLEAGQDILEKRKKPVGPAWI